MKKTLLILICISSLFSQFASAHDLNKMLSDYSKKEKASRDLINQQMLKAQVEMAKAASSLGEEIPTPSFMSKLESIEVIDITECTDSIKSEFKRDFESYSDEPGYETLLNITEGNEKVRVVGKKDNAIISEIFFLALDNNGSMAIIKMTGKLDDSDIADVLKGAIK